MRPYFRQNPIERTDELRWMPEVPFQYSMLGFRDCAMGRDFDLLPAPDAASCFLSLVIEKLEKQPQHIVPIMRELLPAIEHVAGNQALFEADESIFGNFLEKLVHIRNLYAPHDRA